MRARRLWIPTIVSAAALLSACGGATTTGQQATTPTGQQTTTPPAEGAPGSLTVVMREFAYEPDRIELTAGSTVEITFRNEGAIPHEWMVGRDPAEEGGYHEDLLARMAPEAISGHDYELIGLQEHTAEPGPTMGEMHTPMGEMTMGGGDHGHHGAMLLVQPGGEVTLRLHVPADAVGEWEMGCFQPGHYQAGMHGTVVIVAT